MNEFEFELKDTDDDRSGRLEIVTDHDSVFDSIVYGCDLNFTTPDGEVFSTYLDPGNISMLMMFLEDVHKRLSMEE